MTLLTATCHDWVDGESFSGVVGGYWLATLCSKISRYLRTLPSDIVFQSGRQRIPSWIELQVGFYTVADDDWMTDWWCGWWVRGYLVLSLEQQKMIKKFILGSQCWNLKTPVDDDDDQSPTTVWQCWVGKLIEFKRPQNWNCIGSEKSATRLGERIEEPEPA